MLLHCSSHPRAAHLEDMVGKRASVAGRAGGPDTGVGAHFGAVAELVQGAPAGVLALRVVDKAEAAGGESAAAARLIVEQARGEPC